MQTRILVTWAIAAGFSITLILPCRIGAVGDEVFTTYDLASRGKDVTDKNQCYGEYDTTTQQGWGPGYQYSCIYSGTTEHSGGDTVWYNYTLASAGTIFDENTTQNNPAANTAKAVESICPKGWTLPTQAQMNNNRDINLFSPVLGGGYYIGTLYDEDTRGNWWGSTAYNGARRYYLLYNGSSLYTNNGGYRHAGYYVRCIQAS